MKQRVTIALDVALIQKARLAVKEGWYDSLAAFVGLALVARVDFVEWSRGHAFRPRHVRLKAGRKKG